MAACWPPRSSACPEVPTIQLGHLTDEERRAYVLADNKLAEKGGWDADLLKLEVADLAGLGFDLGSAGFDAAELSAFFGPDEPEGGAGGEAAAKLKDGKTDPAPRLRWPPVRSRAAATSRGWARTG